MRIRARKMSGTSSEKDEIAAQKIIGGGGYLLVFSLGAGVVGWIFAAIFSRSDVGIGPEGYGLVAAGLSLSLAFTWISGGMHQALSKYISEGLVESETSAIKHARAGFIVMSLLGLTFSILLIIMGIITIAYNFFLGVVFLIVSIAVFIAFIRDWFIGNLTGLQRFDYVSIISFLATSGSVLGLIGLIMPVPLNWIIIAMGLAFIGAIFQIVAGVFLLKKAAPYKMNALIGKVDRTEIKSILKYGMYSAFPMLILIGTIYAISSIYYTLIFTPTSPIVSIYSIFTGYAGVMASACVFGWPQVPAISEAHARQDQQEIDSLVKTSFRMGYNLSVLFLALYVSQAMTLLLVIHGPEYVPGFLPFIIQSVAVVFIGLIFLACSLSIGRGEAKIGFILILILTVFQIIAVPLGLALVPPIFALYVGPVCLLIICVILFPFSFRYILKRVSVSSRQFTDVLWKGAVSVFVGILIYYLVSLFVPFNYLIMLNLNFAETFTNAGIILSGIIHTTYAILIFLGGAIIPVGIFILCMLGLAGFADEDLDFFGGFPILKNLVETIRKINQKSPFYKYGNQKTKTEEEKSAD